MWGCVERCGLCVEEQEAEDLVMKGNTCEKGGYICKGGVQRTEGCLTEDGVWITEGGENRLLLDV